MRDFQEQQSQSGQWQQRFQYHQYRIKKEKEEARDRKPRRTGAAETEDKTAAFSRDQARKEIAAAVNRVKSRRANLITSSKTRGEKKD